MLKSDVKYHFVIDMASLQSQAALCPSLAKLRAMLPELVDQQVETDGTRGQAMLKIAPTRKIISERRARIEINELGSNQCGFAIR